MSATAVEIANDLNGAGGPRDNVKPPVFSFGPAVKFLRAPFTVNATKFKVQSDWKGGALIVAYIDARLVVERLNHVCPTIWHDEYEPVDGGLLCRLTVGDITRVDIGSGYQGKGLYSDALKRAAVKFGVGVSLYAIPQVFLKVNDGHLKQKTIKVRGEEKLRTQLTPAGERRARELYATWLKDHGAKTFGDPLDHGDAEGAVGDPVEHVPPPEADAPLPKTITVKEAQTLYQAAADAGVNGERLSMWLTSRGIEHEEIRNKGTAIAALRLLDEGQAKDCATFLSDELEKQA